MAFFLYGSLNQINLCFLCCWCCLCYFLYCCCCCFLGIKVWFYSLIRQVRFDNFLWRYQKNFLQYLRSFLAVSCSLNFDKRMVIFGGWFEKIFMQLRLLFGLLYDQNGSLIKLNVTLNKSTSVRFILISVLKLKFLNS